MPVSFLTDYIHEQFPLDDEELSCRHGAETLVGSDEEEGTHPVRRTAKLKLIIKSLLGFYCKVFYLISHIYCRLLAPGIHREREREREQ